ncbi:MAG: beta-L-arabinofuranosidase domain-containing protein [Planctomycetota bacterium]
MKRFGLILMLLVGMVVVSGCGSAKTVKTESESQVVQTTEPAAIFPFEDAAVELPSPAAVQLDAEGRLGERFQGNINYLRHLHDHDGEAMLEAYDTRHYAPNKFLELIWDREYAGKWLDAVTRTAVSTKSDIQLAMVDDFKTSLLLRQQSDGYMGVKLPTDRELDKWEQDWDLWNQWNALNGLLSHYEFRGDRNSLEAASRVGEWIVKTYSPIEDEDARFFEAGEDGFTNVVVIGQLVRLYRHTNNEDLVEFVRQVIQHYPPIQRMRSSGEPEAGHGYMLSAILGGTAEFAQVTRDHETLAWVEMVWESMASDHLFPTGSLGAGESLRKGKLTDRADAPYQETCATTEWIFFTQSLYAITGRAKYVEALENTFYNALLAAQSADGMKWCYFTPLRYHKDWFHGPTKCCYWSGPRGIARFPQLIYAAKDDIIYINFFETSHAELAASSGKVNVTQNSEFPINGRSNITLETPSDWQGTLRIRIPGWTTEFQVHLNGEVASKSMVKNGYCDIKLPQSMKHQVKISFDIPIVREEFARGYLMRRGPEVLSIDVRDNIETSLSWVSFPAEVVLQPADSDGSRRRYRADLEYVSSGEPRSFMFTPYADAGNDGAAFQTVFRSANKTRRNPNVSDSVSSP